MHSSRKWTRRHAIHYMWFFTCLSLMLICHDAPAQVLYGSIVGTVTDSSGSVVPGALVMATQTQTNEMRSATTNDSGVYTLSTVPAGTYTIRISKPGFGEYKATNIVLTINATARVDASLTIGAQTQTVTVSAETAELETDRIDVHGNVSSEELQELPPPTRTYQRMFGLMPAAAQPTPHSAAA